MCADKFAKTPSISTTNFAFLADAQTKRAEAAEAKLAALGAEVEALRATNARLNLRCQKAESAARENVDACQRAGVSFGRSLANWGAGDYRRRLEAAEKVVEAARRWQRDESTFDPDTDTETTPDAALEQALARLDALREEK